MRSRSQPRVVLFAMLHESGHLNPSFKIAKTLRARGHRVRYLAIADVAPLIEAQGFEVEPLFPELFPPGSLAGEQALSTLSLRRAITARYGALLARLLRWAPGDLAVRPDLMVVDVTQVHFALWARRCSVPFVHVNTSLPQTHDAGVPPLRSGIPYGRSLRERAKAELAWARFLAKRRVSAAAAALGGMCPPYELARREAARFGVPAGELDWQTVYMPQLRDVPELVLCPEAFDFPRAARPERRYVESLDLGRSERELDWERFAAHEPLIYCALGGQRYRPDAVPGFFERLARAVGAHPEVQLLVAVGKHVAADALPHRFDNVKVVDNAPQLAVLRRARVMVTHAGLGSVKECVAHGVPMLAVPLDVDQPGNAARVAYHGLGLTADVARSSEQELWARLERLLREPVYRERCAAMRADFERVEHAEGGADWLEQQLQASALS